MTKTDWKREKIWRVIRCRECRRVAIITEKMFLGQLWGVHEIWNGSRGMEMGTSLMCLKTQIRKQLEVGLFPVQSRVLAANEGVCCSMMPGKVLKQQQKSLCVTLWQCYYQFFLMLKDQLSLFCIFFWFVCLDF